MCAVCTILWIFCLFVDSWNKDFNVPFRLCSVDSFSKSYTFIKEFENISLFAASIFMAVLFVEMCFFWLTFVLIRSIYLCTAEELLVSEMEWTPHKIDENLWRNREQIEEILFLLDKGNWPMKVRSDSCTFSDIYAGS
jgi:hypothetical protein